MAKWADYLVTAVSYDPNREIMEVEVHEDLDGRMGPAEMTDKLTMSHNMRKGKTYMTVFRTLGSWKRGEQIRMFSVGGNPYFRIDKNKVSLDNLGDIPDIDYSKKKDPSLTDAAPTGDRPSLPPEPAGTEPAGQPEPKAEPGLEPEPEPAEETPASPHGTLPAAGEVDIPFEDVQPGLVSEDSAAQPEPDPEPEPPEAEEKPKRITEQEFLDYEQDYLRRLEEQRRREDELASRARTEQEEQEESKRQARLRREEKQRQKRRAETPRPAEAAGSPRGLLPSEGEVDIPFEDVQPEQASEPKRAAGPEEEPEEGILSFVDPARGPEHYVRRFLSEPGYKEWFNRNYPGHTIYRAVGISEEEFERIAAVMTPRPEPPGAAEKAGESEGQEMDFDDDDEDEDPTPEQLERFEELERQLEEAIQQSEQVGAEPGEEAADEDLAKPEPQKQAAESEPLAAGAEPGPTESPRGALPADGEVEIPFEEIQPEQAAEPEPEDESVAEQYEQISALSDKIRELEDALANAAGMEPAQKPDPETVEGIIERLDESSGEQLAQLEKLEEQIGQIEDADIESVLDKLHRQVDRLDAIKERIAGSQEPTQEQIDRAAALEKQIAELEARQKRAKAASGVLAYCVRCKAKRSMSDPEETTMKNGRPATRGTCSVCGTGMFRIGGGRPRSKPRDDAPTKEQLDRVAELERQIADLEGKKSGTAVTGYCVKCHSKQGMANPEQTTMKNGRPATRGTCSVCGTGMFRIGKMQPAGS